MLESLTSAVTPAALPLASIFFELKNYALIILGFSLVIFFHELGHFLAARWCKVRVDKFAVGFGKALFSFRKGLGLRWGSNHDEYRRRLERHVQRIRQEEGRPEAAEPAINPETGEPDPDAPSDAELARAARELGLGETEYCFNAVPVGGYVKMLGQEDFAIDKSGELVVKDNPRSFTHKPVGQRMFIVSAGVIMNLLFASFMFMLVFMIGVRFPPAIVGFILPESPAERAGLRVGDRILSINNQEVSDFNDVMPAVQLSDPSQPSHMRISRATPTGTAVKEIVVQPERNTDENRLQIGIAPPMSTKVGLVVADPELPADEQVQVGDVIEAVNGRKVSGLLQVNEELVRLKGQLAILAVRRQVDGAPSTVQVKRRAELFFRPTGDPNRDGGHLLGLLPRRQVLLASAGDRADQAGIRAGDIIVRWGNQTAPTSGELLDSISQNSERPIRVTVLRRGLDGRDEPLQLEIRPKGPGLFSSARPKAGMDFSGQEENHLVVADLVTSIGEGIATPAAPLKGIMPRGALLTKVDDQPVKTWSELSDRFIALAGREVKLSWVYEGQAEQSATIHVPQTLGTTFALAPDARITKIDGQTSVEVLEDGRVVNYPADTWQGAREILRKCVGRTVSVEYRPLTGTESRVAQVNVTPEMLDTWVMRIDYHVLDKLVTELVLTKIQVRNPLKATIVGLRKTFYFIDQVYLMMKRMLITRSMGMEQVQGPIGIVKMGSEVAGEDLVKLLYFLALLSANLAVINFLPLPIVDGGLFVFLIIEKIKGSPISLRVQVATQVIGMVLIIGMFLFVTFNDIRKLFG